MLMIVSLQPDAHKVQLKLYTSTFLTAQARCFDFISLAIALGQDDDQDSNVKYVTLLYISKKDNSNQCNLSNIQTKIIFSNRGMLNPGVFFTSFVLIIFQVNLLFFKGFYQTYYVLRLKTKT